MERLLKSLKTKSGLIFLYIFSLALALFLCFMIGVDNNYVRENRRTRNGYTSEVHLIKEVIEDKNAPMKLIENYSMTINKEHINRQLCFYMVHDYVRVYLDDELVYQLYPTKNGLGKTLGCDWAFIPITMSDLGKELVIEVTPVYKIALENEIDFLIGDGYSVFMDAFYQDLSGIILCLLTCIIGIILFLICAVNSFKLHFLDKRPLLIGVFSIVMGVWKMLDMKIAPLIIFGEPKTVYYIGVILSYIGGATLALYFNDILQVYKNLHKVTKGVAYALVFFSIVMLFSQIFNFRDLRENLNLMHLSLIIFAVISGLLILKTKKIDGKYNRDALELLLLMASGFIIDLIIFNITKSSDYLYFSFLAFFIYSIIVGVRSIKKTSDGIYTDLATGLFNKSYCNKIIDETIVTKGTIGAVMIDLNDLKVTNDLYGHEEGDRLILDLVSCLKEYNTSNSVVGRFGGDEFVILLRKCSEEYVKLCLANLEYKVALVNKTRGEAKISYAAGYAMSESSNETMHDILKRADKNMYQNKVLMKEKMNSVVRQKMGESL